MSKDFDNMSIKELKNSSIYKKLSNKCRSSNLSKVELLNIIKDECNTCTKKGKQASYNILYNIHDFDMRNKVEIGEGAFSTVYLVKNRKDRRKYILKEVEKRNCEIIIEEMDILNKISSSCKKFFLCYNGYAHKGHFIYLITDYIPNAVSLHDYIKNKKNKVTILVKLFLMKQILQGFVNLHKEGVVHMDIKPGNILVTKNLQIKIIDYGFSCIKSDKLCYKRYKGTPNFMAPEVVTHNVKNFDVARSTDVWSIGVTAYYLFNNRRYPWPNEFDRDELLEYLYDLEDSIESPKFPNIVNPLLDINAKNRINSLKNVINEVNKEINNYK